MQHTSGATSSDPNKRSVVGAANADADLSRSADISGDDNSDDNDQNDQNNIPDQHPSRSASRPITTASPLPKPLPGLVSPISINAATTPTSELCSGLASPIDVKLEGGRYLELRCSSCGGNSS